MQKSLDVDCKTTKTVTINCYNWMAEPLLKKPIEFWIEKLDKKENRDKKEDKEEKEDNEENECAPKMVNYVVNEKACCENARYENGHFRKYSETNKYIVTTQCQMSRTVYCSMECHRQCCGADHLAAAADKNNPYKCSHEVYLNKMNWPYYKCSICLFICDRFEPQNGIQYPEMYPWLWQPPI